MTLTQTLPVSVLDYLGQVQSSPMVHAYLADHIERYGRPGHPMQACAAAFRLKDLHDLRGLRETHLSTPTMLAALRAAELQRIAFLELQESKRTTSRQLASTLQSRLEAGMASESMALIFDQIEYARSLNCGGEDAGSDGRFCVAADEVARTRSTLQAAERALSEQEGSLRVRLGRAETKLGAVREEIEARTRAGAPSGEGPASVSVAAATAAALDSLEAVRNTLVDEERTVRDLLETVTQDVERERDHAAKAARALVDAPEPVRAPVAEQAVPSIRLGQGIRLSAPESVPFQPSPTLAAPDVLSGLADFVIGRAQDELVLGLIVRIREWLADASASEPTLAQRAFPATWQLLQSFTSATKQDFTILDAGAVPLTVWRATLRADVRALPRHVIESADAVCDTSLGEVQRNTCRLEMAQAQLAAHAGFRLLDGDPAYEVLTELPVPRLDALAGDTVEGRRLVAALRTVQLLAQGYRVQGIAVLPDTGLPPPFALSENGIRTAGREVQQLLIRHLLVEAVHAEPPWSGTAPSVSYDSLLSAVIGTARELDRLGEVLRSDDGSGARLAAATVAVNRSVGASLDVACAFGMTANGELSRRWSLVRQLLEASVDQDHALVLAHTTALLGAARKKPLSSRVLTMAGLGVALSEARTEAQVQAAFSAVASPVGGWQAKRYRIGPRVSLSAYPGIGGAHEWIVPTTDSSSVGLSLGVSLPIGVEVRVGKGNRLDSVGGCLDLVVLRPCSVGVLVSVLDLGTYLSYRVSGTDGVASAPNMTVRQAFAPGLAVTVGMGRSPVSILLGGQYVPELRRLDGVEEGRGALRATIGLAVDTVLLTF